ncbi:MAG: winged helix-turn-helix domain-containing protein [Hyphomicrobiales bacterium]|nr:winged helix-turn-helix domain-containing protein [Hyphomicrobiales bacterium]
MSADSTGIDPYEAVLADLRAQREKIDVAISAIESLRSGSPVGAGAHARATPNGSAEGPNPYLGMTIPEAAKKLLQTRRQPLRNPDIATALIAGGLILQSKEPANTVGSVLTRRATEVGDIVRVGRGTWGLREWVRGRTNRDRAENGERPEAEGHATSVTTET